MDAVVLVGGEGTRLRPLTLERPKPVLPLLGRPLLAYVLERLAEAGVTRVIFGCGYLPDPIQACFGERALGLELEYVVEPRPLGTAGGIRHAARGRVSGTFLALNGDILADAPLADLVAAHRARGAVATIALTAVADPSRYGLVRTDGEGRVLGFLEKPAADEIDTDLINAGAYVLEPAVLDRDRRRPPRLDRARDLPLARRRGTLRAGAGRLLVRRRHARELRRRAPRSAGRAHPLAASRPRGRVRAGSTTRHSSRPTPCWSPPATSQPGRRWRTGAHVGAGSCVAADAHIEARAHLNGAVVQERARVGEAAVVEDAVIGPRAQVGAGAHIASGAVVGPGVSIPAGARVEAGERVFPEGARVAADGAR